MSPIIHSLMMKNRRAFTLLEAMIATAISLYVVIAVWDTHVMAWRWWAETIPQLELEKAARMTLISVIDGSVDSTAGTYTADVQYSRRNGIAWATDDPTISVDAKTISYRLVPDSSNVRQFYYDTIGGVGYMFYKDNAGNVTRINSTKGITNIQFSRFVDGESVTHNNIIQVVVTAERDIPGTGGSLFHARVEYSDTVLLRNAL